MLMEADRRRRDESLEDERNFVQRIWKGEDVKEIEVMVGSGGGEKAGGHSEGERG